MAHYPQRGGGRALHPVSTAESNGVELDSFLSSVKYLPLVRRVKQVKTLMMVLALPGQDSFHDWRAMVDYDAACTAKAQIHP